MKTCQKCQTKNQESSQFCKKCGLKLSDSTFQDKKDKVMGEKKRNFSWKVLPLAVIAVIVSAGFTYWFLQKGNAASDPRVTFQPKVGSNLNYDGQKISMTDVSGKVENGKISIPVETVLEKKMVRFEYERNGVKIPLLSYVTQTGKVITAVSMCEPCRSTRFHIKGKTLVCNACGTEWHLETLKGIQGGCLNYPPEVIPSIVQKEQIQIDERIVTQWKPRV